MAWNWSLSGLLGGSPGITQTVHAIRRAVRFAVRRPEVRERAEWLVGNLPERAHDAEIRTIYDWVSQHYRFLSDIRGIETVKSPEVVDAEIKRTGRFQGDCDDVTAYVSALLQSIGYKTRLCIIYRKGGKRYEHIYPEVLNPRTRKWVAMELTARQYDLGWEAPHDQKRVFYI